MPPIKLKDLLNPHENGELADVVEKARAAGELIERLRATLPADLAESVVAANVADDGRLVIVASTPARAARLRFEASRLLAAAATAARPVSGLTVRVSRPT